MKDTVKLSTREVRKANFMTYPQSIEDMCKIAKKCKKFKNVDDKVHCLEILRDTVIRFPGVGTWGVKSYIVKALKAYSSLSKVPVEEADTYRDIVLKKLLKGANQRKASKEDVYWLARKIVGKNFDKKNTDLFPYIIKEICGIRKEAKLSDRNIGKICQAILDRKGFDNDG